MSKIMPGSPRLHHHSGMEILRHPAVRIGVGVAGVLALLAVARDGHNGSANVPRTNAAEVRFFEGQETFSLPAETFIFQGPTTVYTTPEVQVPDPGAHLHGNEAFTTKRGEALVFRNPVEYTNSQGQEFLGNQENGSKASSGSAANQTDWVPIDPNNGDYSIYISKGPEFVTAKLIEGHLTFTDGVDVGRQSSVLSVIPGLQVDRQMAREGNSITTPGS